jgi:hypothetical protein
MQLYAVLLAANIIHHHRKVGARLLFAFNQYLTRLIKDLFTKRFIAMKNRLEQVFSRACTICNGQKDHLPTYRNLEKVHSHFRASLR